MHSFFGKQCRRKIKNARVRSAPLVSAEQLGKYRQTDSFYQPVIVGQLEGIGHRPFERNNPNTFQLGVAFHRCRNDDDRIGLHFGQVSLASCGQTGQGMFRPYTERNSIG